MSNKITFKSLSSTPAGEGRPVRVSSDEQPDMPAEQNMSLTSRIREIFHAITAIWQGKQYFSTVLTRLAEVKKINASLKKKIEFLEQENARLAPCLEELSDLRKELDDFRTKEDDTEDREKRAETREQDVEQREKNVKRREAATREKETRLKKKEDSLASREKNLLQRIERLRIYRTTLETREEALENDRTSLDADRKKLNADREGMEYAQKKLDMDLEQARNDLDKLNNDIRYAEHFRDDVLSEIPRAIGRMRQELHSRQLEKLPHEAENTIRLILNELERKLAEQLEAE